MNAIQLQRPVDRPNLKPGMIKRLRFDYSPDLRKGTRVKVVCMRKDRACVSGFRVRVEIPRAKYQRYFDANWVIKTSQPIRLSGVAL